MNDLSTTSISVLYDNIELSPTPLVNYSQVPISFGYVYGYNTDISLDGLFTGIAGTGSAISGIITPFINQFKQLRVTSSENGSTNTLYQWENVTVNSISIDSNNFFSGSFVKYSVKLSAFFVPSGIIDPSNEYSFTQNEDGSVNVNHKISARGVRNAQGAFDNAINFVKLFTGKDPFSNCAPYFVPSGSGVLLSLSENINRADGLYSVTEVYKYNTGISAPYVQVTSLSTNENISSEYKTIDYNMKFYGSPINKNTNTIVKDYLNYDILADISAEFGLDTSNWIKNSYSASVDSGSATIDIKIGYLSGANPSGFFDYVVSCERDYLTSQENWKIDGDFKCFGPLDYKLIQINNFKTQNNGSYPAGSYYSNPSKSPWSPYLTSLITNSPLYAAIHDSSKMFSQNFNVKSDENTGIGTLKLNLDMKMGYEPLGVSELKYTINSAPSRWIYELMSSANIEGSFVVQDLQTKTQPRQQLNVTCKSYDKSSALQTINGYLDALVQTYVNSGNQDDVAAFMVEEQYVTGVYDVNGIRTWLGDDNGLSSGLISLQSIGTNSGIVPIRTLGYSFGY